jgi:hypothetical protein
MLPAQITEMVDLTMPSTRMMPPGKLGIGSLSLQAATVVVVPAAADGADGPAAAAAEAALLLPSICRLLLGMLLLLPCLLR